MNQDENLHLFVLKGHSHNFGQLILFPIVLLFTMPKEFISNDQPKF